MTMLKVTHARLQRVAVGGRIHDFHEGDEPRFTFDLMLSLSSDAGGPEVTVASSVRFVQATPMSEILNAVADRAHQVIGAVAALSRDQMRAILANEMAPKPDYLWHPDDEQPP